MWGWGSEDSSVALDSADKVITEEVDSSEKTFLSKILPQESPVASALLFVDGLGNRLGSVFRPIGGPANDIAGGPEDDTGSTDRLETVAGSALVAQGPILTIIPAGNDYQASFERGSILTYEIESGDSLQSIAADFGISVETLMSVNGIPAGTKLKAGDKISILPIDGVRHTVKSGETVRGLAQTYKADADRIIAFNDLPDDGHIKPGDVLIIPGGEFHVPISPKYAPEKVVPVQSLPNLVGYYGLPSGGRITRGLHNFNAVDIGGRNWCNTPIYASAAGTIITADAQGWNGGYGKYIKIAHPNGTITLYAHESQLLVSVGQYVAKGQAIALMGSTGNSTGCHVHFEVRGARNPLVN